MAVVVGAGIKELQHNGHSEQELQLAPKATKRILRLAAVYDEPPTVSA